MEAYRDPAPRDLVPTERAELVVETTHDTASAARTLFLLQMFGVPPIVAAVVAAAFSPEAGFVALVVASALCVAYFRHRKAERFVLSVHDRTLTVRARRKVLAVVLLDDLLDVELDTETVRRIQEGSSAIPAVRFAEATPGPEIDQSRVVLVTKDRPVALGEARTAHLHATESLGKIRVFLRRRGWLPRDERDSDDARGDGEA